jgi:hypothetical protein
VGVGNQPQYLANVLVCGVFVRCIHSADSCVDGSNESSMVFVVLKSNILVHAGLSFQCSIDIFAKELAARVMSWTIGLLALKNAMAYLNDRSAFRHRTRSRDRIDYSESTAPDCIF